MGQIIIDTQHFSFILNAMDKASIQMVCVYKLRRI